MKLLLKECLKNPVQFCLKVRPNSHCGLLKKSLLPEKKHQGFCSSKNIQIQRFTQVPAVQKTQLEERNEVYRRALALSLSFLLIGKVLFPPFVVLHRRRRIKQFLAAFHAMDEKLVVSGFEDLGNVKIERWTTGRDSLFLYSMYSRVSAAPLLYDSDYSTSNCESNSDSESNLLRGNVVEVKSIELFSVVVRVVKSLNWDVARKVSFPIAVKKYGFDQSLMGFKMFVYVYACAEMEKEVYSLLRAIVCYYQKAQLNLFGLLYALLDSPIDAKGSTFVVNVLIKVFASNRMLENAIDAFEQARRIGFQPGVLSCNFLLKCLAEANERESLVTLFKEMKNNGPFPCLYTYTIMMNFYCSGDHGHGTVDIEEATNILEEMGTIGISPSIVTYSVYILGLCNVGLVEIAWDLIQELKRNGQPLNCYCYNAVIHGFADRDEPDKGMEIFNEMKNDGIAADVYSYSILIEGFCRCRNVEKGLRLFEEMRNNNIIPSLVTYSSILKGLCKSGLTEISLDWFKMIGASGYEYDQHAYNILITGFCVQGDMDSANKLLEEMLNNSLSPNPVSYKSLILGFCKIGSLGKALEYFNNMMEVGFLPCPVTCNHVISGYCKEGKVKEAVRLIDEMRDLGISRNMFTYSAVIDRLCKECKSEKALELIPVMLKCNTFPSVVIYSTLISGFAKQANPRKALMLYTKMLKVGICPDSVTFTILINVLFTGGKVKEAYNLFKEMISKGLEPDKFAYTSMIAGFCRSKDMKKAWGLFQEMVQRDIVPSVVTYTCLIDGFCKVNRMDMASMLLDEMNKKNVCPDQITYSVLIRGCQKLGYVDSAQQLLNEMKNRGILPMKLRRVVAMVVHERMMDMHSDNGSILAPKDGNGYKNLHEEEDEDVDTGFSPFLIETNSAEASSSMSSEAQDLE
ncbi:hypothetical protein Salat_0180000 [Sesamum alatum]|uniref:Pentatricopeptide repeat-containing protein n=1 Tax=Sesamum alatum TaxID=300844 RepID=A0AAE1YYJ8_9LAMI|nr:hypothetical protein Salat_0180000 [Sesamum alatum]